MRTSIIDNLRQLPVSFGLNLKLIDSDCKYLATQLSKDNHLYILGKGEGLPIAKEGALKLKEVTYIHAEAFSAGELKHGPIALIEPERNKTKVILVIMDDEHFDDMILALSECKARLAYTIVITNCPEKIEKADYIIKIIDDPQ